MDPTFETTLEVFRTKYKTYRNTNNANDQIAYMNTKKWLDAYIAGLNATIESDRQRIQTYVASYASTNPELVTLSTKMRDIREKAPKLQDDYITTKKRAEKLPEDMTSYYAKAAIVVGLIGIAGAMALT